MISAGPATSASPSSSHSALGLDTERFQDLYHFTVGKAVIDARLDSEAAYAHLKRRA
jgi:hypothetical protein